MEVGRRAMLRRGEVDFPPAPGDVRDCFVTSSLGGGGGGGG